MLDEKNKLVLKIDLIEKNKKAKAILFDQMVKISEKNKEHLENLTDKVKNIQKKLNPRCTFGWKCRKPRCEFDHTYLYKKVNKDNTEKTDETHCEVCKRTFVSASTLKKHGIIHLKKHSAVKCNQCDKVFVQDSDLQEHERKEHTSKTTYNCDHCEFVSEKSSDLEQHRRQEHPTKEEWLSSINAPLGY